MRKATKTLKKEEAPAQTPKELYADAYDNVKESYLSKNINYEQFLKSVEAINKQMKVIDPEVNEFLVCEPIDFIEVAESPVLSPNEMSKNVAMYKVAITQDSACGLTPMLALQKGFGLYEIEVRFLGRVTKPLFDKKVSDQLSEILKALEKLVQDTQK